MVDILIFIFLHEEIKAERLSNLLKVIQLVNGRAEAQVQAACFRVCALNHRAMLKKYLLNELWGTQLGQRLLRGLMIWGLQYLLAMVTCKSLVALTNLSSPAST